MTLGKTALMGAAAGLAGAFAMQQFRSVWNHEVVSRARDGVFGLDDEADLNSIRRLEQRLRLPNSTNGSALRQALILHYLYGAVAGSAYALLRDRFPEMCIGNGTASALALWLVGDELAMAVSGISNPAQKSLVSHVSAVAAHLLFGATVEGVLRTE